MRPSRPRTDAELLAATASDPRAFGEFYRRHERAVLGFFMHCSTSAEVASDLMAETFAAALESAHRFLPELGEPRAWLFGIARNMLARSIRRGRVEDATRRRLGFEPLVVDDAQLEQVEALLVGEAGPAVSALGELSLLLREAVAGRVLEERDYRELAERLECSESVVRQRVRRGLVGMRKRLEVPR